MTAKRVLINATALLLSASPALAQQPVEPAEEPAEPVEANEPDPGVVAPAADDATTAEAAAGEIPGGAGYDGGFFIHGADPGAFSLEVNGRVQTRYAFESVDTGTERDEESAFSIARARIKLSGHAHSEAVGYKFQADFGKGFVVLKDFYVDYARGGVRIRAGQWKKPFSRQQLTSSGKLELINRAITDDGFGAGRDIGLAVHGGHGKSPAGIGWTVGVFNGTGDKPSFSGETDPMTGEIDGSFTNVPDTFHPEIVARADLDRNGIDGFSEADLQGGPLRYAVGASVMADLDADDDDASNVRAEADFVVKQRGLSATGGVYVATAQDDTSFADQAYSAVGFHGQAGYVIDRTWQPVVRYARVDRDGGDTTQELTAGLSIYAYSHQLKWQTDASLLSLGDSLGDAMQARTQLQLAF